MCNHSYILLGPDPAESVYSINAILLSVHSLQKYSMWVLSIINSLWELLLLRIMRLQRH